MHRTTQQPQATFWGRSSAGLCSRNDSPDWLKMKNPKAAAVKREAEEDWDELFVYNRHRHLDI
jgi:hypothetical protein